MGGDDTSDNLVLLTAREHYLAHVLLHKMYPDNNKLLYTVMMMSGHVERRNFKANSHLYQKIAESNAERFCKENAPSFKDFTGLRFGRLTVVNLSGWRQRKADGANESQWLCECDCGNYKEATGKNLQQGTTKSCGCLVKDTYPRQLPNGQRAESKGVGYKYKSGRDGWDCEKYDRPWKSPSIMQHLHNEAKWKLADYYYNHFMEMCPGKGFGVFWKIYKETHNDDLVKKNYFSLMVSMFNKGWVPKEDEKWIEFSEGINNE